MNPEPLPPSLRDLEDQLARRPGPEPTAEFRSRVLRSMADVRTLPVPKRTDWRWRLVWRAAAAVILALNLGMSAANGLRFQRLTALAEGRSEPPTARPRIPAGLDEEDRFQAFAASALASWAPAPDIGELGRNVFDRRGALP
jgi:hypothetical protein